MRPLALLCALTALPGCKKFPDLGGIDVKQALPTVRWDRMRVDHVDFEGLDVAFVFDVDNPYPVDMRLASFTYDLDLDGTGFLDGTSSDGLDVPASGSSKVRVPAHLGFADVVQLVGGLKGRDAVGFALKGDLAVDTPLGPVSVPYERQGDIPVLKAPGIEPKAVRLGSVELLQNRATVEVDVALTNHATSDAYGLHGFAYGIELGGKRVIDGALADLSVAAGATEVRTIPVTLNLLQLGTAVANAVTQKKPVDVRLDADLQVDTPLGAIPLAVDRTVSLRVQ